MADAEESDFLSEPLGEVSIQVTDGPDPHLTYRWPPITMRNITLHSFVVDLYRDGRIVSVVDIENVSHHSNWDVWGALHWKYTTGHEIPESNISVVSTAINHQHRRTERQLRTFEWLAQNYSLIQRADVKIFSRWGGKRNN